MRQRVWKSVRQYAPALLVLLAGYMLVVGVVTYPLATLIFTGNHELIHAFTSHPDTDGTLWFHWWFGYALDNGLDLFHTEHLSYPTGENLWLTCGNLVLLVVLYPIFQLCGPVVGYNVSVWVILMLNCGAGYLLSRQALRSRLWGFFGGVFIGINNFLLCEIREGRLEQLFVVWLVLSFWALLKIERTQQRRYVAVFALLYALTALSSWHYGIMLSMVLGLWLTVKAVGKQWRWIKLTLAGIAGGLLLILPVVVLQYSAMRSVYQWDITGGAAVGAQRDIFQVISAGALAPGQLLFSARCCQPALGVMLAVVLAACCLSGTVRRQTGFWFLLCIFALAWALGPVWGPWQGGDATRLPYYYLVKYVPVMTRFFWPERYIFFVYMAAAIIGLTALKAGWSAGGIYRRVGMVLLAAAAIWAEMVLVGNELWDLKPQRLAVPRIYRELAKMPPGAVLELPLDSSNLYFQTIHQKPAFMSSVPYPPILITRQRRRSVKELGLDSGRAHIPGAATVTRLREKNFRYIIVHEKRFLEVLKFDRARWEQKKRQLDDLLGQPRVFQSDEKRYLYVF